jgi:AraC family transcriptional activator of mtrCDE
LKIRCSYGAPWRVAYDRANSGELPYHVIVGGSAVPEIPGSGAPQQLVAGNIVLLSHRTQHILTMVAALDPCRLARAKA